MYSSSSLLTVSWSKLWSISPSNFQSNSYSNFFLNSLSTEHLPSHPLWKPSKPSLTHNPNKTHTKLLQTFYRLLSFLSNQIVLSCQRNAPKILSVLVFRSMLSRVIKQQKLRNNLVYTGEMQARGECHNATREIDSFCCRSPHRRASKFHLENDNRLFC
jgi:hypothetical protein